MADQPNVLVLNTDQQRVDCLGCYGGQVETPTIDALAESGIRCTNMFVPSPNCCPSRASMFTGNYPHTTGVYGADSLPHNQRTIVEYLSRAGYQTDLIGKWHLGTFPDRDAPRGFDQIVTAMEHDTPAGTDTDYLRYLKNEGVIEPEAGEDAWRTPIDNESFGTSEIPEEHHMTTWLADRTIERIDQLQESDDSFYLHVGGFYPHFPIAPPAPYDEMYDPSDVDLPANSDDPFENKPPLERQFPDGTPTAARKQYEEFSEADLRKAWALTYGLCSHIDTQFGRIIQHLEETGLRDDTIIVYLSDHGEMLGSHGLMWKGPFLYDELVNVPFIISHPDTDGRTTDSLLSMVDFAPTIAEVTGVDFPEVEGESFAPLLFGEETDHRSVVYAEYLKYRGNVASNPVFMVRGKRYKYVVVEGQGELLYDLSGEPSEVINHADDPEYGHIKRALRNKLNQRRPEIL